MDHPVFISFILVHCRIKVRRIERVPCVCTYATVHVGTHTGVGDLQPACWCGFELWTGCAVGVLLVMAGCSVFHILVVLGRNAFCYIMPLD